MIALFLVFVAITQSLAAPADLARNAFAKRGPADYVLESTSPLLRRSSLNYVQDYTTGGTVDYTHSSTGFDVKWDAADDFSVGVGWNPGSTVPISFNGSFSVAGGSGLLAVYGWTLNPIVEYYIIEDSVNPFSFGIEKGSVISDGGTYTVWETQPVIVPPIVGESAYKKFYSVRNTPRTVGTVTVENHFNAWESFGMDLGTLNYQVVAVEAWQGSGSASFSVSN